MFDPIYSTQVEDYFTLLAAQLAQLPEQDREEHLRELHQHVVALVGRNNTSEQGEEQAIAAALRQMGSPVQIGSELCREWERTNWRPFWKVVSAVGIVQFVLIGTVLAFQYNTMFSWWHAVCPPFQKLPKLSWDQIFTVTAYLIPLVGGAIVGRKLPGRAMSAAFLAGLIGSLAHIPWSIYAGVRTHQWELPYLGVSGYEILAAYIVSSLKRRDWTFQLQ